MNRSATTNHIGEDLLAVLLTGSDVKDEERVVSSASDSIQCFEIVAEIRC